MRPTSGRPSGTKISSTHSPFRSSCWLVLARVARGTKWCVLGGLAAFLLSMTQAWMLPTRERFFAWSQSSDGQNVSRGEVHPTGDPDFAPHANPDGSVTYVSGIGPPFILLPWPIRGLVIHTPAGESPRLPPVDTTPRVETQYYADVYGWPFPSAAIVYSRPVAMFSAPLPANTPYELEFGIRLSGLRHSLQAPRIPRALPLLPWPGLVLNAPLYGLCLWLIWTAIRWSRSRLRRRGGRCPSCAYPIPLHGIRSCPECGWRAEANSGCGTQLFHRSLRE